MTLHPYAGFGLALLLLWPGLHTLGAEDMDFALQRRQMVREVEADARLTAAETGVETLDACVLAAIEKVPRHEFVPVDLRDRAYDNRPLPIGSGQTISQPFIVALMTALLKLKPEDAVLEVGTGSGYQAAVLSELVRQVYSIEIVEDLAREAGERLKRLGYGNVEVRSGDGYQGWEAHAPFDAIIVTAAATHIPAPLVEQLKPGGRMAIPVGEDFLSQQIVLVEKREDGSITTRGVLPVAFVPLTGGHERH